MRRFRRTSSRLGTGTDGVLPELPRYAHLLRAKGNCDHMPNPEMKRSEGCFGSVGVGLPALAFACIALASCSGSGGATGDAVSASGGTGTAGSSSMGGTLASGGQPCGRSIAALCSPTIAPLRSGPSAPGREHPFIEQPG